MDEVRHGGKVTITVLVKDLPFKKCKKYTSRSVESTLQEVKNLHPNNTYFNNTYNSDIKSYLSIYPKSKQKDLKDTNEDLEGCDGGIPGINLS